MDISGILSTLSKMGNNIVDKLVLLLPKSPFNYAINLIGDIPFLNYINWFIPFGVMVSILEVWLISVATFYVYMIILRWVKAID